MNVMELVRQNREYTVALRREFHQYPEVSWKEFRTTQRIREELDKLNIPYVAVGETGTVATLKGNRDYPVVGLRADIDALPIQEVKDLPYKSKNEGVMHACGHDSHIAMLLSAAKVLSEHRDELNCTVKFIFQPAEEAMNGALSILDSGLVDDLDTVAGMHIFPKLPAGTISVDPGPRYTSAAFMNIKIIGRSGHGAMPESAVDPIYVGCKVVDALQSITSREANPNDTVVVSICTFHCGTRPNIIAEYAELSGTVRTFNPEMRKSLPHQIERIIKGTCEAHRASYEFDYYVDLPATITDERCSRISERAVKNSIGEEHLIRFPGTPGGEDFSYFLERTPGVYAFIGCRTPENDCLHELHSDKFNLDEDSMLNGAAFYVQYTLEAQDEQW